MTRRQAVRVFDRPTVADWQVADFDEVKRLLVRHLLAIVRQDGQRVAAGAEVEVAIVEDYGDLFIRNKVAMVATVDVLAAAWPMGATGLRSRGCAGVRSSSGRCSRTEPIRSVRRAGCRCRSSGGGSTS